MDKGKKQLQIELWQECNNHCTFCVPEGSKVILNNFTNKNIEDVKIGDEVFTYKRDTNKLVSTKVLNVSKRYINEPIYRIEADGNILNISLSPVFETLIIIYLKGLLKLTAKPTYFLCILLIFLNTSKKRFDIHQISFIIYITFHSISYISYRFHMDKHHFYQLCYH